MFKDNNNVPYNIKNKSLDNFKNSIPRTRYKDLYHNLYKKPTRNQIFISISFLIYLSPSHLSYNVWISVFNFHLFDDVWHMKIINCRWKWKYGSRGDGNVSIRLMKRCMKDALKLASVVRSFCLQSEGCERYCCEFGRFFFCFS